jgi:hypothetical protein
MLTRMGFSLGYAFMALQAAEPAPKRAAELSPGFQPWEPTPIETRPERAPDELPNKMEHFSV